MNLNNLFIQPHTVDKTGLDFNHHIISGKNAVSKSINKFLKKKYHSICNPM